MKEADEVQIAFLCRSKVGFWTVIRVDSSTPCQILGAQTQPYLSHLTYIVKLESDLLVTPTTIIPAPTPTSIVAVVQHLQRGASEIPLQTSTLFWSFWKANLGSNFWPVLFRKYSVLLKLRFHFFKPFFLSRILFSSAGDSFKQIFLTRFEQFTVVIQRELQIIV